MQMCICGRTSAKDANTQYNRAILYIGGMQTYHMIRITRIPLIYGNIITKLYSVMELSFIICD